MNTRSKQIQLARYLLGRALMALLLLSGWVHPAAASHGSPDIVWSAAGHSDAVTAVDVSPDGRLMATASNDRTLKLWSRTDGSLMHTLVLPYDLRNQVTGMSMVRFTPDGAQVVAAVNLYDSMDRFSGAISVFRVSDGALLRVFGRQGQASRRWTFRLMAGGSPRPGSIAGS
jgi:WD40 repeat protein